MRNPCAHLLIALGLLQKVANLFEFFNRFVNPGDVGELRFWTSLLRRTRLGAAKLHSLPILTSHLLHKIHEDN